MNTMPSIIKSLCLILALASVSLPVVSLAGDTDPNGVKLMLLHEEPKFKADLKEKTGGAANTAWDIVCGLEVVTLVGLGIWDNRRGADKCLHDSSRNDALTYCIDYSYNCNHYQWDSKCLLDKKGEDYCSKP
jgi:hypothetical protein